MYKEPNVGFSSTVEAQFSKKKNKSKVWLQKKLFEKNVNRMRSQKSYLFLHFDIIRFVFSRQRFPALSSPMAKLAFVLQNLLIIFAGSLQKGNSHSIFLLPCIRPNTHRTS